MSDTATIRRPRRWHIAVFLAPAALVYSAFMIIPLADTLRLSLFHVVLPFLAYGALAGSGSVALRVRTALFAVACAALLLLFIGIHNAWDAVTYHIFFVRSHRRE